MTTINHKVDWLTLTFTDGYQPPTGLGTAYHAAETILKALTGHAVPIQPSRGLKRYQWSFLDDVFGVQVHLSDSPMQGCVVVMTGITMSLLEEYNWSGIGNALALGWDVTRIDIAYDLKDAAQETGWFLEMLDADYRRHPPRTYSAISKSGVLQTLYVGSRFSDVMARWYDKAAERHLEGSWLRYEVEFKREEAQLIAMCIGRGMWGEVHTTCRKKFPLAMPHAMKDFSDYLDTGTEPVKTGITPSEKSPAYWLWRSVRPTLIRLAETDPEAYALFLNGLPAVTLDENQE